MGQIGYILAQAMSSAGLTTAPIICQVVVDPQHDAFRDPSKFIGPVYGAKEATALSQSLGWVMKPDGEYFRRVVPSPPPVECVPVSCVVIIFRGLAHFVRSFSVRCAHVATPVSFFLHFPRPLPVRRKQRSLRKFAKRRATNRILQVEAIRTLLEQCPEILPIACGGGGIPVSRVPSNPQTLQGVEAVIDKDRCGGKLANELDADGYIILTDGGGIWQNFGKPDAREMKLATPEYLLGKKAGKNFPGSMGPKIQAAIDFVQNSTKEGAWAAIGDLRDASKMFTNEEGTLIKKDVKVAEGVVWRESKVTIGKMKLTKDQSKYG